MRNTLTKILWAGLALILAGSIFTGIIIAYFSFTLPELKSLKDYRPAIPTQILAKDGTILTELGNEKREMVDFDNIPSIIVDAFISAEDNNFYQHDGVDFNGVLRALISNIKAGRVVQGGSTITQQVAKSFLTRERSITRKIKDFLLAIKLEKKFTKKEILFLYLNEVYLGGGYYGVKAAFKGYFNKALEEATISESAMVAGLLVAPGRYSPYIKPKYAKVRQKYVLGRMFQTGKISKEEYEQALNEKIKYYIRKSKKFRAGHFTDWVRQRLIEKFGDIEIASGGYKVQTTIDWELQSIAEDEVIKGVKEIDKRQGYKGPIETISEDERIKRDLGFRKEIIADASEYFTLTEDHLKEFELVFNEEEITSIQEYRSDQKKKINSSRFLPGNLSTDSLIKFLTVGDNYKGTVVHVDNSSRLVYVSIGDLIGIIPYSGFRWAHERVINDERKYFPYVTSPSKILKKGDVVEVLLEKKSVSIEGQIWKAAKSKINSKLLTSLRGQRYLLLSLDQSTEVEGALVSIRPENGHLVSMVGGANFLRSQFNRAIQSLRQPGSSFKPLLFAAALENGYTPNTIILDSPEALGGADERLNWKPRNYDGKFKGPMTFRRALEISRNIPTIKIAEKLGVPTVLDFLTRIGFKATIQPDLSLSLGSFGVTLMDIVNTYSVFPNGGKKITNKSILSIVDRKGIELLEKEENGKIILKSEVIEEKVEVAEQEENKEEIVNSEESKEKKNPYHLNLDDTQVYDKRLAYIMTNLLRGVVLYGTGRRVKEVSTFLGGKTGTTSNYVDAWFIGFSTNLVTGVWTGFDNNKTLGWPESGSKAALPIWKEYMRHGIKKYGEYDFVQPEGIVNVLIDKVTGKLTSGSGPNDFMEAFVDGTETHDNNSDLIENNPDKKGQILDEDDYYNNQ